MPAMESKDLHGRALLWRVSGVDNYAEILTAAPVEIRLRLNDSATEALDPQGNKIGLDATIVTAVDLGIGDVLWMAPSDKYSALEQYTGTGSGVDDSDYWQVKMFNGTPDLKNRITRREAGIMRFRGSPPELA